MEAMGEESDETKHAAFVQTICRQDPIHDWVNAGDIWPERYCGWCEKDRSDGRLEYERVERHDGVVECICAKCMKQLEFPLCVLCGNKYQKLGAYCVSCTTKYGDPKAEQDRRVTAKADAKLAREALAREVLKEPALLEAVCRTVKKSAKKRLHTPGYKWCTNTVSKTYSREVVGTYASQIAQHVADRL